VGGSEQLCQLLVTNFTLQPSPVSCVFLFDPPEREQRLNLMLLE
jgi:hypothetical protein